MRRRLQERRVRPSPAPELGPDEAERLGRAPADDTFVTGNGLAARCRHVVNYGPPAIRTTGEDWWFCKLDRLDTLLLQAPREPFVLLTHNSDYPVDARYRDVLGRRDLRAWLAANAAFDHPKLIPVPLGIANPCWEHGDTAALRDAQRLSTEKHRLLVAPFAIGTNRDARTECVRQTGVEPDPYVPHREYLARLASARFCLSPPGHGLDTHRTWEALYLRTIPIVLRSPITAAYDDLPWLVLDSWRQFHELNLTPELYERTMGDWSPERLGVDALVARLRERVAATSARRPPARYARWM